jgi:hypothetical protein
MEFSRGKNVLVVCAMTAVLTTGVSFGGQNWKNVLTQEIALLASSQKNGEIKSENEIPVLQKLANPPSIIKAIYVTGWSAGAKSYRKYLDNLFKNTEINAVVIDVKDSSGYISYVSNLEDAKKYKLTNYAISDIDNLIKSLHEKNIYVIARIAVFEDPVFAKYKPTLAVYDKQETKNISNPVLWQDNNKLSWVDPASKDVWDYNISIAKDASARGFDEINFDYIRFPSDGQTKNMGFPVWDKKTSKQEVIRSFFKYLREQLPDEKLSVDLFGQTTTNTDDMGIGQVFEDALEYFDFVSPMIYPSHYVNGFSGFTNPAKYPYEVVKYSTKTAFERKASYLELQKLKYDEATGTPASALEVSSQKEIKVAKFRPWLQDFNMGAKYTADMVKLEITAVQDFSGEEFVGFMLWNPYNIYTQEAVKKDL